MLRVHHTGWLISAGALAGLLASVGAPLSHGLVSLLTLVSVSLIIGVAWTAALAVLVSSGGQRAGRRTAVKDMALESAALGCHDRASQSIPPPGSRASIVRPVPWSSRRRSAGL